MGLDWLDRQKPDQPFFLFLPTRHHYDYVRRALRHDVRPGLHGHDGRPQVHREARRPREDGAARTSSTSSRCTTARSVSRTSTSARSSTALREKGLLDSTVVMILSDHGEEFFEHGNKGHHRTVYDEVLRVPFALRLPGGAHAGEKIAAQASTLDVFPTLLDAAGFTPPGDAEGRASSRGSKDARRRARPCGRTSTTSAASTCRCRGARPSARRSSTSTASRTRRRDRSSSMTRVRRGEKKDLARSGVTPEIADNLA